MTIPDQNKDIGAVLHRLHGVVLGEGLAFDRHDIVLKLRVRASTADLDPSRRRWAFVARP